MNWLTHALLWFIVQTLVNARDNHTLQYWLTLELPTLLLEASIEVKAYEEGVSTVVAKVYMSRRVNDGGKRSNIRHRAGSQDR